MANRHDKSVKKNENGFRMKDGGLRILMGREARTKDEGWRTLTEREAKGEQQNLEALGSRSPFLCRKSLMKRQGGKGDKETELKRFDFRGEERLRE